MIGIVSLANNNKDYYINMVLSTNKLKNRTKIKLTSLIDNYIMENTILDNKYKDDIYELPYNDELDSLKVFFNKNINRELNEKLFKNELDKNLMIFSDVNIKNNNLIITSYRKYKSFIINFIKNNYNPNFLTSILKELKHDDSIVVTDIKTKEEIDICNKVIVVIPVNQKIKLSSKTHLITGDESYIEKLVSDVIDYIYEVNNINFNDAFYISRDDKITCIFINTNSNKSSIMNKLNTIN